MSARAVVIVGLAALAVVTSCAKGGDISQPDGGAGTGGKGGAQATSSGTGGASTTSTSTGSGAGGASPCDGVACHAPPPNVCADDTKLTVFDSNGTCDKGLCSYLSHDETCPNGCSSGACNGDPCAGVTCASPPANACADAAHLTVYTAPGTCTGGACGYPSQQEFCASGCSNGACNGDPCVGVSCNMPPANFCSGPNELTVNEVPGTCASGSCSYQKHTEYCAYGCVNGACAGDPCAGVTCATPPASYCSGQSTRRVYDAAGACSGGACTYAYTDQACAHGCANGACLECVTSADCPAGKWCNANACAACNDDQHCGPACSSCAATGEVCNATSTACVECAVDAQCGGGKWCNANTCAACADAQHCGPSCAACSGTTPTCGGAGCVCSGGSCGSYNQCVGGTCAKCNTDAACGSACAACGGTTPHCLDQGATTQCVECLSSADCVAPKICSATNACVDACSLPTNACANGGQSRDGCANARIIGRSVAGATGGFSISDNTCYANDKFDDGTSCWDANGDHAYRIFLRKNESISITLTTGWDCAGTWASWNATLKIFTNAGCTDTACSNKVFCDYNHTSYSNKAYTAPQDGWYILVVDGSSAFDDYGDYTLKVKLTCNAANCEC